MPSPLKYRPPYVSPGRVAPWLSAIGARSGVYVIRSARSGRVLYVGESHTGRLRKTLLRHFQAWSGRTAGNTYAAADVECAVRFCPPPAAVACQNNLICRLDPRDNDAIPAECKSENPF